jgi:hypothetical protein
LRDSAAKHGRHRSGTVGKCKKRLIGKTFGAWKFFAPAAGEIV